MSQMQDPTVAVKEQRSTVEIRDQKHQLTWFFSKEDATLLSETRAVTFSQVEVDGQALRPIRDYPFSELPERVERGLEAQDFTVIG